MSAISDAIPGRGRAPRRRRVGLAIAAVGFGAALGLAGSSGGEVPANLLVPSGSGITTPGGIATTPDGAIWVTDHVNGVCRVTTDEPRGLVETPWCGAAHRGPIDVSGLAFDASTSSFYAGDIGSDSGAVWQLHWDAESGAIDGETKLQDVGGDRVVAVAVAPTGQGNPTTDVYFSTKRDTPIWRFRLDPGSGAQTSVVGLATEKATPALSVMGDTLYLAEPAGVTEIPLDQPAPPVAEPIPGLPVTLPGGIPTALAVDEGRNRIYAGTTNENGQDQVDVVNPDNGEVLTYSTGFSGITAMTVEADGSVLLGDDPAAAAGALDPIGQARIWRIPFGSPNVPETAILDAPPTFTNQTSATFTFTSRAGVAFQCRLDAAPFAACGDDQVGGGTSGSASYDGLAPGTHAFEVFAVDPAEGSGPVVRRTFVVDLAAPQVSVDNPPSDQDVEGDALTLRFSSSEEGTTFVCSLDGAAPSPCDSPLQLSGLSPGPHTFRVAGADRAGNASDPGDPASSFTFTVSHPPAGGATGEGPSSGPGDASGPGGSRGGDVLEPTDVRVSPVLVLRPRTTTLGRTRVRRRYLLAHPLGIAFNAHEAVRYARITLQPYWRNTPVLARRRRQARIVASLVVGVDGGRRNYVRWRLTRAQAARLRPGRYRLTVAVGETARSFGPQKVLVLRVLHRG